MGHLLDYWAILLKINIWAVIQQDHCLVTTWMTIWRWMKRDPDQDLVCIWKQDKIRCWELFQVPSTGKSISLICQKKKSFCSCYLSCHKGRINVWRSVPLQERFKAMCTQAACVCLYRYHGGIPWWTVNCDVRGTISGTLSGAGRGMCLLLRHVIFLICFGVVGKVKYCCIYPLGFFLSYLK